MRSWTMLLAFAAVACAPAEPETAAGPDPLDEVAAMMTGSFSSAAQAAADGDYFDIRLEMVPIWTERDDARWLYVEQAAATALDRPYRQRVYRVTHEVDGSVVSAVYELPGDPLDYAGAWSEPFRFDAIAPENLSVREGCAVVLRPDGEGRWTGSTIEDRCKSTLRGASYATSEVTATDEAIESWDRGFDAAGEQVWGAEKGAYVFVRG